MNKGVYRNISAWTNDDIPYVQGKVEDGGSIKAVLGLRINAEGDVPQWVIEAWTNYFQRALHRACIDFVHAMAETELNARYPLVGDGGKVATPVEEGEL